MKIFEATERPSALITDLLQIWENSVRSTHTFLSESEILEIKKFVPQALAGVSRLVIATENGRPTAFMGTEGQKLEMLFVAPAMRGKGIGKALLLHATEKYSVNELTVNEENPLAKGFYEHMGFTAVGRSEVDGQGNPYPVVYMKKFD